MGEPTLVGWLPGEAEGAYPNGTRIMKVESEPGDGTELGEGGKVLASHYVGDADVPEGTRPVTYFYFVVWDYLPSIPVGVSDWKIGKEVVPVAHNS